MASTSSDGEFGLQIAPMLDVLFVLLLFFMVSAGVQKREASIAVPLPGKSGPEGQIPVRMEIATDGQVYLNGAASDQPSDTKLSTTVARLKTLVADSPRRPILLTPADDARQQRVIDVLNACLAAHVSNIAFTSRAE